MKTKKIILPKGKSIQFLDYTIKNSLNNDGLVLFKGNGDLHECHLGNYGEATEKNIDFCKKDAIVHFMVARPAEFAKSIVRKVRNTDGGTHLEYLSFKSVCFKENIEVPEEITAGGGTNFLIYFKDKPLDY